MSGAKVIDSSRANKWNLPGNHRLSTQLRHGHVTKETKSSGGKGERAWDRGCSVSCDGKNALPIRTIFIYNRLAVRHSRFLNKNY
ncbi:hypothetical protein OS493_014402 [Desmophyllum pertusum]|uniref:Uncharacterized protein n=1 Tax=Desmophyllum pertusum TaxID=174260 RepID=A0A9X0CKF7_9CNID|nr:hypothetical protein OS493_014402 [Desmophyllum pertusum]